MEIVSTCFEIQLKTDDADFSETAFAQVDASGFAMHGTCQPTGGRTFFDLDWNDTIEFEGQIRHTLSVKILEQNGKKRA